MSPLRQSPLNEVPPKLYAKGDLFERRKIAVTVKDEAKDEAFHCSSEVCCAGGGCRILYLASPPFHHRSTPGGGRLVRRLQLRRRLPGFGRRQESGAGWQ